MKCGSDAPQRRLLNELEGNGCPLARRPSTISKLLVNEKAREIEFDLHLLCLFVPASVSSIRKFIFAARNKSEYANVAQDLKLLSYFWANILITWMKFRQCRLKSINFVESESSFLQRACEPQHIQRPPAHIRFKES